MSIQPRIGHLVNFKDENGKVYKGWEVISKDKGFNFEGKEVTYYIVSNGGERKRVFPEDMEYYHFNRE